ncbi:hypothetical protein [Sphingomonas xinjiangensis]|uniref:Uncharacterized protein n=1 Tax=Sphingomonas xinjiangensis TaxID=643568 RepID=A0A840YRF7_9SPHN|nr:hypothetical protein [Sphingomonas xinjiangensis]MBB5711553.1 hypothetical protein [Sphingomonas xinjiangensis]
MSAVILLVVGATLGVGDFLLGRWMLRLSTRPQSEWPTGIRVSASDQLARFGRALMIGGPIIFLVLASFAFGLIPVESITPIQF